MGPLEPADIDCWHIEPLTLSTEPYEPQWLPCLHLAFTLGVGLEMAVFEVQHKLYPTWYKHMLYIISGTISSVSIVLGKSCAVPFFQTYLFMLMAKFYECVQCGSKPKGQRTLKGGAWEAAKKALGSKLKKYISEDSHEYVSYSRNISQG